MPGPDEVCDDSSWRRLGILSRFLQPRQSKHYSLWEHLYGWPQFPSKRPPASETIERLSVGLSVNHLVVVVFQDAEFMVPFDKPLCPLVQSVLSSIT